MTSLTNELLVQIEKLTDEQKKELLKHVRTLYFEGRQHDRMKYLENIEYMGDGRLASGFIQDISAGGLSIKPTEPFLKDQEIIFYCA